MRLDEDQFFILLDLKAGMTAIINSFFSQIGNKFLVGLDLKKLKVVIEVHSEDGICIYCMSN